MRIQKIVVSICAVASISAMAGVMLSYDNHVSSTTVPCVKRHTSATESYAEKQVKTDFMSCVVYQKVDSVKIENLLAEVSSLKPGIDRTLFLARKFLSVPYVAHTLEKNETEKLVVNTRELDCTTFVETVTSLRLCSGRGEATFEDYCRQLACLRYKGGEVSYTNRLHYFTSWIEDNENMGFVKNVSSNNAPFTAVQTLDINYMTTHVDSYAMLRHHKEWLPEIRAIEENLTGRKYRYIPKDGITNTALLRQTIHDGDIIAILTSKKGLDTSHIGIAVWHEDGVHLLNASQIHKKVVEEPMLLHTYMKKHPSQIGIRLARM